MGPTAGFRSAVGLSASRPDRPVAIPLMTRVAPRVRNRYNRMDRANDAKEIPGHRARLGLGPILDPNPPCATGLGLPHRERYQARSTVERAFGRLQDELGGRPARGRGHTKVTDHLMFGGLALPVDQRLRLLPGTRPFWGPGHPLQVPVEPEPGTGACGPQGLGPKSATASPPWGGWPLFPKRDREKALIPHIIRDH